MKVLATSKAAQIVRQDNKAKDNNLNFKGSGGLLGTVGTIMQGIENQGYFASFLIQDGLGMTIPRVWTGFNRDKEVTGKYNTQEGTEVLLREGLTGPYMMLVAPFVLWGTTKVCRSTNTNTNLIRRYGNALKDFVKDSKLSNAVKNDAQKFKSEFSRINLEKIYKNSIPNDKNSKASVEFIIKEFEKLNSSDKKVRKEALNNISEKFNEKILETSPDFYQLNTIKVGEGEAQKAFNTKEAISALNDFCEDAIVKNKNFASIDENAAENIKNNFATKRLLTNIANIALTLGGLSVIPKIYAKSDVAPGAQTLNQIQENNTNNNSEVSFKGKGINSDGIFSKIGKFLMKNVPEKFSELFEYTGHNFTKATFLSLSIFGLLFPRGKRAWDRAKIDENGKRDMTEINEILLRDTVSSFTVVLAVPTLTKMFINAYEEKLGFVLTNKASEGKSGFKKFLDIINPFSKLNVLSLADLDAVYGNIDSKTKLMNFAEFINKNGGDLEKILSKSENTQAIFNEKTFTLDSIKSMSKTEKNNKIIELFKKIKATNPKAKHKDIALMMQGTGTIKNNKIAQTVRGLCSLPSAVATFLISPILLGVLIPKLTYFNTRNTYKKQLSEESVKNS